IWEKAQPNDTTRAPIHVRIRLVCARVSGLSNVQSELVRFVGHFRARLHAQSARTPSFSAKFVVGREVAQLEQVHEAVTVTSKVIPKCLVAAAPQDPRVAALNLFLR